MCVVPLSFHAPRLGGLKCAGVLRKCKWVLSDCSDSAEMMFDARNLVSFSGMGINFALL